MGTCNIKIPLILPFLKILRKVFLATGRTSKPLQNTRTRARERNGMPWPQWRPYYRSKNHSLFFVRYYILKLYSV